MKSILLFALTVFCVGLSKADDSLSCQGKFDKSNAKHGIWKCKNSTGKVVKSENYKHGSLIGYTLYNDKGQIIETRNRKGKIRKFNPCGC